jgi:hypothetical protein
VIPESPRNVNRVGLKPMGKVAKGPKREVIASKKESDRIILHKKYSRYLIIPINIPFVILTHGSSCGILKNNFIVSP